MLGRKRTRTSMKGFDGLAWIHWPDIYQGGGEEGARRVINTHWVCSNDIPSS